MCGNIVMMCSTIVKTCVVIVMTGIVIIVIIRLSLLATERLKKIHESNFAEVY